MHTFFCLFLLMISSPKILPIKRLPPKSSVLHQIQGFYGIIGPDVLLPSTHHKNSVKTLYELFTGDGIIQGVFFDGKGHLHPIQENIVTEKRIFEQKHGKMPNHISFSVLSYIMYKMKMIPNLLGYANTALGSIENKLYAFYERDMPYLLEVDFEKQRILTSKRISIPGIDTFSGHTKYEQGIVDTIDYDVYNKQVHYFGVDPQFRGIIQYATVKTKYMPVIHDFAVLHDPKRILFLDSPFLFDVGLFIESKIPVLFDPKRSSYFHIVDPQTGQQKKYELEKGIMIFHYADIRDTPREIELWASVYDQLSFNDLKIVGRYRKIHIDKLTRQVTIQKNPEIEKYNLDFPVTWEGEQDGKKFKRVILRSFDGQRSNGFVVCEGLQRVKEIWLESLSVCGEPVVVKNDSRTYLLSLAYDKGQQGYLVAVDLDTWEIEEIALDMQVSIGFHSIFIENIRKTI